MNRVQKYEQTDAIMAYLEKHKVRQVLNNLLKQLIVHKPADPLEFLQEKLSSPLGKCNLNIDRLIVKRYILIGPSEDRKAFAMKLKDDFRLTIIDCGVLLRDELEKKAADGEQHPEVGKKIKTAGALGK